VTPREKELGQIFLSGFKAGWYSRDTVASYYSHDNSCETMHNRLMHQSQNALRDFYDSLQPTQLEFTFEVPPQELRL
jgi:hypothetical protein